LPFYFEDTNHSLHWRGIRQKWKGIDQERQKQARKTWILSFGSEISGVVDFDHMPSSCVIRPLEFNSVFLDFPTKSNVVAEIKTGFRAGGVTRKRGADKMKA
jgi:hypothetical protein